MTFTLTSSTFKDQDVMPKKFTCDGQDLSPALSWQGAPEQTRSYALIVDDPDAPSGTWTHWIMFNIPSSITSLKEGSELPQGALNGLNSWGATGYRGPCPPNGTHRYFFRLYALDTLLNLPDASTREDILKAMDTHILAASELMVKYR